MSKSCFLQIVNGRHTVVSFCYSCGCKVSFCQQEDIEQVILVGGATRVPKVQEVLLKAVGK